MSQGKEFFCVLKPIEPYFLGGERNFVFGERAKDKMDYYITSEDSPQQSTVLGLVRYLMLSKGKLLSDAYYGSDQGRRKMANDKNERIRGQQEELIGAQGFCYEEPKPHQDYGKLYSLSPLFLVNAENHRMIRTPLNHVKGEATYRPFAMQEGYATENGKESILPVDFKTKDGLTDSFVDMDDENHKIIDRDTIFKCEEHTRIGRGEEEDGYFKMVYKHLSKDYAFGFYCQAEAGTLPKADIVYMGQGKSPFRFTAVETDGGRFEELRIKIRSLPGCDKADVYYAASDVFMDISEEDSAKYAYTIIEKKLFRTLNRSSGTNCYRSSRKKSELFQLVRAGSVFYLKQDAGDELAEYLAQPGLQQVGFNYVEKLGGK